MATLRLTQEERAVLEGQGASAMAMRIVVEAAGFMGAERLVEITSAHIDGCLYHGDGGVEFAEKLVQADARVRVPTTLNVGALDLLHPGLVKVDGHRTAMARRQMVAYEAMGCQPTWTCAPYQVGHRPGRGEQVAWGESNAIAFANSVLGARTERYGDFLDICCALTARAPLAGLHLDEKRRAAVVVDTSALSPWLKDSDVFYPVLGSWLGTEVGSEVAAIDGLPPEVSEDRLKALGAAASSTGAVGLFHVVGVTPEAPDLRTALGDRPAARVIRPGPDQVRMARDELSTVSTDVVDAVALGSPHFSQHEFEQLIRLARGRRCRVPFYVCTSRGVLDGLDDEAIASLEAFGVEVVADTCVVVTPILPAKGGVLMTNSGKFAHYSPSNTGYEVVYGSLADCVASAEAGRVVRDEAMWA